MAKGSVKSKTDSSKMSGAAARLDEEKAVEQQVADFAKGLAQSNAKKEADLEEKLQKLRASRMHIFNKKKIEQLEKEKEELSKHTTDAVDEYERMLKEKAAKEELEDQKQREKELAEYRKQQNSKVAQANAKGTAAAEKIMDSKVGAQAVKVAQQVGSAISEGAEKYMGLYATYMSKIDARIQGAGKGFDFQSMSDRLSRNLSGSPFLKYSDTLENLSRLVEAGVADNVVQRAFLETIKDKIATTFDALNENLLRLVRIQRNDTTAARLGMEASLTRLFNYYFSDTSYLSNAFDSVSASLLDLSAQLDSQSAVELEYIVQKWLGALGSVGVSNETLTKISEGITYLGTGNIEALSSDEALQNLIVMATNRTPDLEYSAMLTEGVSAGQINELLASIISYVQDISSSGNNVVKQQYAQLFGISLTDMRAFQNLSDELVRDLYTSGMTYKDTLTELNNQMGQVAKRTHFSEMIDNIFENVLASTGMTIASNPLLYGTYKAADMLESITGGINLPFISAMGTGLDLNMSLEGLMKGGILGIGTVASLIGGIGNLFGGTGALGKFDTTSGQNSRWYMGADKSGGFTGYQNAGELSTTQSTTNYVSSGNELGIQQSLSDEQKQTGKDVQGEEKDENADTVIEVLKFIKAYFEEGGSDENPLKVIMTNYVTGSSNIDDSGITFNGANRRNLIP